MIDVLTDMSDAEDFNIGLIIDVRDNTVIGVLTGVMVGGDNDMSGDVEFIVVTTVVIDLEFTVIVSCVVDVLADVIICGVSDIGVGVLAGASVIFLAAVRTVLTFVTAPSNEAMPCS